MKNVLVILSLLFSTVIFSQNDFESRYFTIGQGSLPSIPRIDAEPSFSLSSAPRLTSKLYSLKVTKDNYWQPVDMASAVAENNNYIEHHINLNRPKPKKSGLSLTFGSEENGSPNTTYNTVYKESRGWYDIRPSNYSLGRYSPYSSSNSNYRPFYYRVNN